jgi:hypothetical protein
VGEHWHKSKSRKLHGISGEFEPEYSHHGNETTFVVCNRKEVIDLTLGTNKIENLACI